MPAFQEVVFGIRVSGSTNGALEDLRRAVEYVDEYAERLRKGSPVWVSKEQILALLAVGVADDLLQLQRRVAEADRRLDNLLKRIDGLDSKTDDNTLGSA